MPADRIISQTTAGSRHDWRTVHLWQVQFVRDLLVIAALLGVVYLGYLVRIVTIPMLLAMTLAYLFEPVVQRMVRGRWFSRQGAAAFIIFAATVLVAVPVTVGIGFGLIQGASAAATVANNTRNLITAVQQPSPPDEAPADGVSRARASRSGYFALPRGAWQWGARKLWKIRIEGDEYRAIAERRRLDPEDPTIPRVRSWKEDAYGLVDRGMTWANENAGSLAAAAGQRALGTGAEAFAIAGRVLVSIGGLVFTLFLTAFFFFFFCAGYGKVLAFWESLIPDHRKHRAIDLLRQMDRVIAGFVRGRLTICAILAGYLTVAYWFIGVPAPLIVGPVFGLLFIVPYASAIGPPIAMLLMSLEPSGWAWQQEWWWIVGAPIGVYIGGQLLDDYVLTPNIQGKTTGMDSPTILFASIAGGALAGMYGLLLAIPAAACVKIILREIFFPRFRAWAAGRASDVLPIANN